MKFRPSHRIAAIVIACLLLAGLLGAQSTGIALTRKSPSIAVDVFPANGLAHENLATAHFILANTQPGESVDLQTSEPLARRAYVSEPLSPKALSILALSLTDDAVRSDFTKLASQINRRDQRLLAVVLQENVRANDYRGTVETLDNILRVRPSRSAEFFPILMAVFSQEGAVDEFRDILDGTSPWHRQFLNAAAANPDALPNVVRLRSSISFAGKDFDKTLIRKLAEAGDTEEAAELYEAVAGTPVPGDRPGTLPWGSEYAPLDWSFADDGGFRAQTAMEGDQLEIYIRSGQGGLLAKRFIVAPSVPATLVVTHDLQPSSQARDVGIAATCAGSSVPVAAADFASSPTRLSLNALPTDCEFVQIQILGRAWTGRAAVRGILEPIRIAF